MVLNWKNREKRGVLMSFKLSIIQAATSAQQNGKNYANAKNRILQSVILVVRMKKTIATPPIWNS